SALTCPSRRSRRPTSAPACCRRCCPGRSTPRSAASGTWRAWSCASAARSRPIPVDKLGVPEYDELVFVANKDKLDDQRDDLRLFIAAVARGAEAARQDSAGATKALLEANPDLKEKRARASVRLT